MALFPGALPAAGAASASDTLAAAGHTSLHNTGADESRAIATKIGTGASTPTSGMLLRGGGAGASAWAQANLTSDVTGVLPQANGGTGTTLATGTGKAVYDTSPTLSGAQLTSSPALTAPIIADFTNATHTHGSNATGGTLNGANALQAASVPDSRLIYGKVRSRQGGSATNWQTTGTTAYDYSATDTIMQCGSAVMNASPTTITFPTAFNQTPIVVATANSVVAASVFVRILNVTTTNFQIQAINAADVNTTTESCNWIAVGQ